MCSHRDDISLLHFSNKDVRISRVTGLSCIYFRTNVSVDIDAKRDVTNFKTYGPREKVSSTPGCSKCASETIVSVPNVDLFIIEDDVVVFP